MLSKSSLSRYNQKLQCVLLKHFFHYWATKTVRKKEDTWIKTTKSKKKKCGLQMISPLLLFYSEIKCSSVWKCINILDKAQVFLSNLITNHKFEGRTADFSFIKMPNRWQELSDKTILYSFWSLRDACVTENSFETLSKHFHWHTDWWLPRSCFWSNSKVLHREICRNVNMKVALHKCF